MLVISGRDEARPDQRIWGSPSWLSPERREAVDWVTLARFLGWGCVVGHATDAALNLEAGRPRVIIVACEPDVLSEKLKAALLFTLQAENVLVLARAGETGKPWTQLAGCDAEAQCNGRLLEWIGPGPGSRWHTRRRFGAKRLHCNADVAPWLTLDGSTIVAARQIGRGTVVTLGLHPSGARDQEGCATAFLKHLLLCGTSHDMPALNWANTMILRMDDPGGAQNVYLRSWYYRKLDDRDWTEIGCVLRSHNARLSVGYVSGWVDDGSTSTTLQIDGSIVERAAGQVYPSPLVRYVDRRKGIHDYTAEYRALLQLRGAGLIDIAMHGYTHMNPDRQAWVAAPDRYQNLRWFREFGEDSPGCAAAEHPLALGMKAIQTFFGESPSTIIFPGETFTDTALETALDLGIKLIGSYYLGIRYRGRFCWVQHVCAPYLDQAESSWFDSGLPVVGYFHDRDIAEHGISWLASCLAAWVDAGATRYIAYRDRAGVVGRRQ
jgi:hypothetical protein